MLTYAQKKYLFAIYKLGQNTSEVRSADIARIVGVSKASTVKMTQRLCDDGYIMKEPYGRIELTETGIREANALFTKCIIICDFLNNMVGVEQQKANSDSVTIVSQISEETTEKLVQFILNK